MGGTLALIAGRIYASFRPLRVVRGLVVHRGRVLYSGSSEEAVAIAKRLGGDVLELPDSTVVPGLVDAHTHLESLGLALNSVDLRGTRSIEELKTALREWSAGRPGWVFGRGWDQEKFREGRFPTRWDVDEAVGDRPVILVRVCGHMALLNTAAAEELRVEELAKERLVRNESGEFTGLVVEEGVEAVMRQFWSRVDEEALERYLLDAARHAVQYGVTTLGLAGASLRTVSSLAGLSLSGRLPTKVMVYLGLEAFRELSRLGQRAPMLFGRRVGIVGVKLFVDGSLGARTAYLSEPYDDAPETRGLKLLGRREIAEVASRAERLGFQVAVHAIGDAALDEVIEGLRGFRGRARVEHLSVVRDDQLVKLGELGAVGVVQPHFILTDWWVLRRVGARRARWVYRFGDLGRHIPIALSTDSPVEPIDPWENLYAALTRGLNEGIELAEHTRDQRLSVADALHYYTSGSAYALGLEDRIGRLEPGYDADLVVLDRDPLELDAEEIRKTRVVEVYVDGERVYP